MIQPENQEVTVSGGRDAIASALGLTPARPRTEAAATPAEQTQPAATPATAMPPTAEAVAPTTTPTETIVAEVAPETVDPYLAIVDSAMPTETVAPAWTPEGLNAFKAVFQAEDPVAYHQEIQAKLTAAELLKAEQDKITPIVQALNSMPPALQKAFGMAMEGKLTEAQDYIRSTATSVLQNAPAKDLTDKQLIDERFPGKVKPEEWAMLSDPEADADIKAALKTRVEYLRATAADMHDADLTSVVTSQAQQEAARKAQYETYKTATASTISLAKSSPLGKLLDTGTVEQLTSGQFLGSFVEQDGVTPKPEAATLFLWAKHGPALMKAAETRGYNRGKQEGSLATTQRQPSLPPTQRRSTGDTPINQTDEDRLKQLVFGVLTS